jgi:hypothetical protein
VVAQHDRAPNDAVAFLAALWWSTFDVIEAMADTDEIAMYLQIAVVRAQYGLTGIKKVAPIE